MSDIHHIGGGADALGRFQAYLDRSRAVRTARRRESTEQADGALSFDSAIDPDRDGGGAEDQQDNSPGDDDSERHELDAQA